MDRIHKLLSRVQLSVTLWTVAPRLMWSWDFPRQEYWSRWPFPSPGNLPDPGIDPGSPALHANSLPTESSGKVNLAIYLYLSQGPLESRSTMHRNRRYFEYPSNSSYTIDQELTFIFFFKNWLLECDKKISSQ